MANNVNLGGLRIAVESFGKEMMLTAVKPYYAYVDGKRTDTVQGYAYTVALPELRFAMLSVKIEGEKQLEAPQGGYTSVQFVGLAVKLYYDSNNKVQLSAKATGIRSVGQH